MLMFAVMCLVGAVLLAKPFPETPTGRRLHQILIETPARWLSSGRAKQLLRALVMISILCWAAPHGVPPIALPLDALASFELSTLVEVAAALAALSASALLTSGRTIRSARRFVLAAMRRCGCLLRPRARSERSCPTRRAPTRPSATDEGEPGRQWAFAIA